MGHGDLLVGICRKDLCKTDKSQTWKSMSSVTYGTGSVGVYGYVIWIFFPSLGLAFWTCQPCGLLCTLLQL